MSTEVVRISATDSVRRRGSTQNRLHAKMVKPASAGPELPIMSVTIPIPSEATDTVFRRMREGCARKRHDTERIGALVDLGADSETGGRRSWS